MQPAEVPVDAWIDIGGTFTDCFVHQQGGRLASCKVLSSGRVPLSLVACEELGRTGLRLHTAHLAADAAGFWVGAQVVLLNEHGQERTRLNVRAFADGILDLEAASAGSRGEWRQALDGGARCELDSGLEAPVLGVRRLLGCPLSQALPRLRVRLGTTKGTNALLTRSGAQTALAVTEPFTDLLAIGDQTRPDLFALDIVKPQPLASCVVPIRERLAGDGSVLCPLDSSQATEALQSARAAGCQSLAICLMHSYLNPQHEQRVAELARELGFENVSVSSELAPLIEIVARAQTTVVDAYLSPIVRDYLRRLVQQFQGESGEGSLHVMTSAGGLVEWQQYSGKDSILSGPAGGVRALRELGRVTESAELIGLDMGGTSTDVCRVTAEDRLQYESSKADVRILTPTLPIETVAAGGGSICWFDGVSFRVGPQSAGSLPGPACYGRGGPLTLTDLNVFLGRVPVEQFPFDVDLAAIERRLEDLQAECEPAVGRRSLRELAEGFRKLAAMQMAEAVRSVTIAEGTDPRAHTLVGFGGAAGQHICEVAELLGIAKIIDSAAAGMLSALGMGVAEQRADDVLPVYQDLTRSDLHALQSQAKQASQRLEQSLIEQGASKDSLASSVLLELRYAGTDATLSLPWSLDEGSRSTDLLQAFHRQHAQHYGYQRPEHGVEIVSVRVQSQAPGVHHLPSSHPVAARRALDGSGQPAVWQRETLQPGDCLRGPGIVCNAGSTLVIDADWQAQVASDGTLFLTRDEPQGERREHGEARQSKSDQVESRPGAGDQPAAASEGTDAHTPDFDPIFRDCYAARLTAIASQMGLVLQQTAVSVNIKRRRDFSCAVFDAAGDLLANAPHVPVHLGAMGQTVRSVSKLFPGLQPGEHVVTNDPYRGGSHLPDITLVTPVFDDSRELSFWVASRAHHADVGGIAPGSMSVQATRLSDEGVLIPPMILSDFMHDTGESAFQRLAAHLQAAPHPPRDIHENLADIAAQLAANRRGAELLAQYAAADGWQRIRNYAEHLLAAGDRRVQQFIESLELDAQSFEDRLDDGSPICVCISQYRPGRLRISFAGTAGVNPRNFNANPSIVTAAVLYVLRCLIADDMPMNEGALRSIDLDIPPGILNPPVNSTDADWPAVAAGNVETSQRVVDVLLGAFGAAAASQGTMNNLLFGNDRFGFYETICGGAGATSRADGASGVHTHMTNTRLTDPEVLEANYPVRLVAFGMRPNSGGAGTHRGGDGVVREIEFLEPVTCSLLTSRRGKHVPFGMQGGKPGKSGRNWLVRDEVCELLPACCQFETQPGVRLRLETPGGGGYGPPESQALGRD